MYFIDEDGDELILTSVIKIDAEYGNTGRKSYAIHLSGGQHITVKESFKTRASFIVDWKAANA